MGAGAEVAAGAGGIGGGGTYSSAQAIAASRKRPEPSRMVVVKKVGFKSKANLRVLSGLLWSRRAAPPICSIDRR